MYASEGGKDGSHKSLAKQRKTAAMRVVRTQAFLGTKKGKAKASSAKDGRRAVREVPQKSFLASVTDALDFSEARSKSDAWLLYEAKTKGPKGGKLSKEQEAALKRKIIGTKKDYWKDWVDVQGKYTEKGYVSTETSTVYGAPLIGLTLLGVISTLGFVISQTS